MTKMSKSELISATKARYLKASKKEKTKILEKFCQNTGYNRKYAICIFKAGYDYHRIAKEGRKKRKQIYGNDVLEIIIKIWELLEYPCGARLKPSLIPMLYAMERSKEIRISGEIKLKLKKISAKTLDRRLGKEREVRSLNRNRGTTKHGSLLKSSIPIRITDWDTGQVGFMEMDTVSHNGGDQSDNFISSLNMVEIYSGWSEQCGVMGKGEIGVVSAIDNIRQDLPFDLSGLDSDGGSEFITCFLANNSS